MISIFVGFVRYQHYYAVRGRDARVRSSRGYVWKSLLTPNVVVSGPSHPPAHPHSTHTPHTHGHATPRELPETSIANVVRSGFHAPVTGPTTSVRLAACEAVVGYTHCVYCVCYTCSFPVPSAAAIRSERSPGIGINRDTDTDADTVRVATTATAVADDVAADSDITTVTAVTDDVASSSDFTTAAYDGLPHHGHVRPSHRPGDEGSVAGRV